MTYEYEYNMNSAIMNNSSRTVRTIGRRHGNTPIHTDKQIVFACFFELDDKRKQMLLGEITTNHLKLCQETCIYHL